MNGTIHALTVNFYLVNYLLYKQISHYLLLIILLVSLYFVFKINIITIHG